MFISVSTFIVNIIFIKTYSHTKRQKNIELNIFYFVPMFLIVQASGVDNRSVAPSCIHCSHIASQK
jgi:hypothetical protein